jgi:DNA-binding CsgD family transcriptional regulator
MQEVSSRIGFDKLGTAATLAWELQAAYSAGDLPVLRRVAAEGSQWWRRQGAPQVWDSSFHVGMALEEGRLEDAAVAYEHFLAGCPSTKHHYDQRLKMVLAAATGDRGNALLAIRRAIEDDFARWPGVRKDRAEALARRLQGASGRADGELTAREREVAALVASGLTNGQLADRLFISPKTAAVHVSNILAKLGLSSRAEIAAWAVRHDLSA